MSVSGLTVSHYYKDSPPDDVIGIPDTREMGSTKLPENQLSNLKNGEKGGEAHAMATPASDDTSASGNGDVKSDADASSKENSTKRDSGKSVGDALSDIGFTNKSSGGRDANGFHNDTVHIYLDKEGKVHNTSSHKHFLDNHKDKTNKVIPSIIDCACACV